MPGSGGAAHWCRWVRRTARSQSRSDSAYAGLLAGLTAALAGRVAIRIWWPIHKVAALTLAAVWAHGVLAGSDTKLLLPLYLGTGGAVVVLALSRYAARTPADRVEELTDSTRETRR